MFFISAIFGVFGIQVFTSLFKFIFKYFILSDTIVNGTFHLIFFSDHSLLVYRNTTNVCILILCPENLSNLFISSKSFLCRCGFFWFSLYRIKSSVNRDNFTCFPIWVAFISFSCSISLARSFSIMLKKSDKSGYPCLATDLGETISSSALIVMSSMGFIYELYYVEIVSFYF